MEHFLTEEAQPYATNFGEKQTSRGHKQYSLGVRLPVNQRNRIKGATVEEFARYIPHTYPTQQDGNRKF